MCSSAQHLTATQNANNLRAGIGGQGKGEKGTRSSCFVQQAHHTDLALFLGDTKELLDGGGQGDVTAVEENS